MLLTQLVANIAYIDWNIDMGDTEGRIDPKLLEILVCPVSKTTLIYDQQKQELISKAAGLAYPIRDGIPIMLVDEARALEIGE